MKHASHAHRVHRHRPLTQSVPRTTSSMPSALRWSVFTVFGSLWLTGIVWLVVHWRLRTAGEYGFTPHPAEPVLMRAHGILAVAAVYLLGWLTARHVLDGLRKTVNRRLGIVLASLFVALAFSGYALYYTTGDRVHGMASIIHEIIGLGIVIIALVHWRRPRRPTR